MVHNTGMIGKIRPATIRDVLRPASEDLKPKRIACAADHDLGRLEAEILLAHVLKKDRTWLHAHDTDRIAAAKLKQFRVLVARRKKHEPVASIVGQKEFHGHAFLTARGVLIPRPESELLVELADKTLFRNPSRHDLVWDVGTGSGAIAIAIAKEIAPRTVLATDISPAALALAKKNARRLGAKNVTFLKADLLDANVRRMLEKKKPARLVIVANLPYLPESDRKKLEPDVVNYEPASALFAPKGGLGLIEKLLRQISSFDIHVASFFLEYDPPQTKKLRALAKSFFPKATVRVRKDLAGRDRVLEITRP